MHPVDEGCKDIQLQSSLVLADEQSVLYGKKLGEESVDLCSEMFSTIDKGGDLENYMNERIDNPMFRRRILSDISSLIPSGSDKLYLDYRSGPSKSILHSGHKKMVKSILSSSRQVKITITGILSQMRVTQGPKNIMMVGPEGRTRISYSPDTEAGLFDALYRRTPVKISGIALMKGDGRIERMVSIEKTESIEKVEKNRILVDDVYLTLKKPLELLLDYSDDMWIMKNEELGIYSQCKDYNKCLEEAEEEFVFIMKEYLDEPDKSLTKDAISLKNSIRALLG